MYTLKFLKKYSVVITKKIIFKMALFSAEVGRFLFLDEDHMSVKFSIALSAENSSSAISGRSRICLRNAWARVVVEGDCTWSSSLSATSSPPHDSLGSSLNVRLLSN